MKKFVKRIICLLFVIGFISYTFVIASAASKANTIAELRGELSALKATKKANESKKNKTKSEISESNKNITNAKNEITTNQGKIEQAKVDIVNLNQEIVDTEESIKKTIQAYQLTDGENVYLEYVFDATSYEELVYRYAIVEQILDYNNEQIDKYNDLIKKNEQLQIDLA